MEQAEQGKIADIDEYQLDRELVRQPKLVMEYGLKLAQAKRDLAEAKKELAVYKAGLEMKVRNMPSEYGITKTTESAIEAVILTNKGYNSRLDAYNDAKYLQDMLEAAMDSLENRKKALESLVYLHGQNYFSKPRVEDEHAREVMNQQTKEATRRVGVAKRKRNTDE